MAEKIKPWRKVDVVYVPGHLRIKNILMCPDCGSAFDFGDVEPFEYCPRCGVRRREDAEET